MEVKGKLLLIEWSEDPLMSMPPSKPSCEWRASTASLCLLSFFLYTLGFLLLGDVPWQWVETACAFLLNYSS